MTLRVLRDDKGLSLTELAVYIVLLGIVSAIVAATMITLFRSEDSVSGLTNSANESQVFVSILNQDIRSAREVAVRDDGTRVVASVASRSAPVTWSCVTWQVTNTGAGQAITRNGNVILEQVTAAGEDVPFFSTSSGVDVRQEEEDTLAYQFVATDGSSGSINVNGTVSNVAQGDHSATPHCI